MRRVTGILVALCVVAAGAAATEQDGLVSGIPELRGHRFSPTLQVPSPIIRTFLRNSLGVGTAKDVSTPPFVIGGVPVEGLRGDLTAANLSFEYQLALKRWLAVRAQFGLTGQFGTGVQTLLAEGAGTTTDFQFGWIIGLHEGEKSALSASLQITNRTVTGISVLNLVNGIVEGTSEGLTQRTPVLNAIGGLRGAWALNELVGLTATAGVGNGETLDRARGSQWFYRTSLAVSFDLDEYGLPLGAAFSGLLDNFGGEGAAARATSRKAGLRLSYIGRESFVLSVDLMWIEVPTLGLLEEFSAGWTGVTMQYYF